MFALQGRVNAAKWQRPCARLCQVSTPGTTVVTWWKEVGGEKEGTGVTQSERKGMRQGGGTIGLGRPARNANDHFDAFNCRLRCTPACEA